MRAPPGLGGSLRGVVMVSLCLSAAGARAASPTPQTPIIGQDVLGDRSRSGPDGWVQAPVTRNQAASGKAPGQTEASVKSAPDAKPSTGEGKTLPAGEDPGTPAKPDASGPGVMDAPSAAQ